MNQIDAAIGQYSKTIIELSARLAQAAAELMIAHEKIEEQTKELEELKMKVAPELATVKGESA